MTQTLDAILLIADNHVRRRGELRRFFWESGFLVAAAADGRECLAELLALEPHVLVVALELARSGGDSVIARLNDGLPVGRKPLVLIIGDAPRETLSARTGVAPCNCFSTPFRHKDLLQRIAVELAVGPLRAGEDRQRPAAEWLIPTVIQENMQ